MDKRDFYFEAGQDAILRQHYDEIIQKITSQTDKVVIKARGINDFTDVPKRRDDPNYLKEEEYKELEDGISILYPTKEFISKVKDIIPASIKELTIPAEFLGEIDYLSGFPNLEKLTVTTPCLIPQNELDWISENTKIKEINLRSDHTIRKLVGIPGVPVIIGNVGGSDYKGIEINVLPSDKRNYGHSVEVYKDSFEDMTDLDNIYRRLNADTTGTSSIKIYKDATFPPSGISFYWHDQPIERLTFDGLSPTEVSEIYKRLSKKIKAKNATVVQENKTYDDIFKLKQLNRETNLEINYDNSSRNSSLADFIAMRETIDYYKELITSYDLSPVEQAAYVYDLLKSWHYNESEKNTSYSRNIHSIIREGKIVCGGYATFAKQLLMELGIPAINVSVSVPQPDGKSAGHARNIIRIDDDKYNIHGLYAMDITWDSDREISVINYNDRNLVVQRVSEEMQDKIIDRYPSQSLYRYFLVPMSEYEVRFPNETLPMIYEAYKNGKSRKLVEEARHKRDNPNVPQQVDDQLTLEKHTTLFSPKEGALTVERYFDSTKPSLEKFKSIAKNVRIAQGYTNEEANYDVKRVTELHRMINEQNPQQPNLFFRDEKTK